MTTGIRLSFLSNQGHFGVHFLTQKNQAMKTLFLIPFIFLLSPWKNGEKTGRMEKGFAKPNLEVVEVKPVDAGGKLYYLACAPRTSGAKP